MRFAEDDIVMGKKFCNKIYNAARYILLQNPDSNLEIPKKLQSSKLTKEDKRILKKLESTISSVSKDIDNFRFGKASHTLYDFFWHDFCDKYLEESKNKKGEETTKTLLYVLKNSLILLHPFIPFITEEIYQKLPIKNKKACLMIEQWPKT
jgi:valyl-tRNA synthetase